MVSIAIVPLKSPQLEDTTSCSSISGVFIPSNTSKDNKTNEEDRDKENRPPKTTTASRPPVPLKSGTFAFDRQPRASVGLEEASSLLKRGDSPNPWSNPKAFQRAGGRWDGLSGCQIHLAGLSRSSSFTSRHSSCYKYVEAFTPPKEAGCSFRKTGKSSAWRQRGPSSGADSASLLLTVRDRREHRAGPVLFGFL